MGSAKVLHIITRLWRGGAPSITLDLLRGLEGDGLTHALATGLAEDAAWDLLGTPATAGLRVLTIPSLTREVRPLSDLRALLGLTRLLRWEEPDLVHVHTYKAGFLGRLGARFAGKRPVVYSPHGSILTGYFSPGATRLFVRLDAWAARFTDRVICCTAGEVGEYLAAGIGRPDQYVVIPNGLDGEAYARRAAPPARTRAALGLASESRPILCMGRLVPVKGQTFLLQAWRSVLKGEPRALLLLAGEGPDEGPLCAQAAALGLIGSVRFLGFRQDIPSLLTCAEVLVLPSLNEGFGMVLLEAMAMGKPVVASAVGGVPEVVLDGRTGLLVPPADPVALAAAILRLLGDPDTARRLGEAGRERGRNSFSREAFIRAHRDLYGELLGLNRHPGVIHA